MVHFSYHPPVPVIDSIRFQDNDLRRLVQQLTTPLESNTLRNLIPAKARALLVWTLKVQRLPLNILPIPSLAMSLRSTVNCPLSGGQAITDALEAIARLLRQHPSRLLPQFVDDIESLLKRLVSDDAGIRSCAAEVISAFAYAKLNLPQETNHAYDRVCHIILSFVDTQTSKKKSLQSTMKLPSLISTALIDEDPRKLARGPIWALTLLAAFIILGDHQVFSHPRLLKLALPSIANAASHKRSAVRALHPFLWKCLVWAFARIPADPAALEGDEVSDVAELRDLRNRAFLMVKQETKGDIGLALIVALLDSSPSTPCASFQFEQGCKALQVLEEMIAERSPLAVQNGIMVLNRLLAHSDVDAPPESSKVVPLALLDGTIQGARHDRILERVRALDECTANQVRRLGDAEISQHWNLLLDIWLASLRCSMRITPSYPTVLDDLLHSWQTLLLAKAQLTQEMGHLTAPTHISTRLVTAFSELVEFAGKSDESHTWLDVIGRIWDVTKNVFASSWLGGPAEDILGAIMQAKFDLASRQVKESWSTLCAKLISTGLPTIPKILVEMSESQAEVELQRRLWSILAKAWQTPDSVVKWEDLVCFLVIPLSVWRLSDSELEQYRGVLRAAISAAGSKGIHPVEVIEHLLAYVPDKQMQELSEDLSIVLTIASHVTLEDQHHASPSRALTLLNKVLVTSYPRTTDPLPASQGILRLFRDLILACPASLVRSVLVACQDGLCQWIRDDREVVPAELYNDLLMPIYCHSLDLLKTLPPSPECLQDLSKFLASAFVHFPRPALGPVAFRDFWTMKYHGIDDIYRECPEDVKECIRAIDEAYGGNLAVGFSMDSESDLTTPRSVVSDSQPSRYGSDFDQVAQSPPQGLVEEADDVTVTGGDRCTTPVAAMLSPLPASPHTPIRRTTSHSRITPRSSSAPLLGMRHVLARHAIGKRSGSPSADDVRIHGRAPALKRLKPPNDGAEAARMSKRRRTDPQTFADETSVIDISNYPSPITSQPKQTSRSTSRRTTDSQSQPLLFDGVEVPSVAEAYTQSKSRSGSQSRHPADSSSAFELVRSARSPASPVEDYDSWEVGMASRDVDMIRADLGLPDDDQGYATSPGTADDAFENILLHSSPCPGDDPDAMVTESLDPVLSSARSRLRDRSQTEPIADLEYTDDDPTNLDAGTSKPHMRHAILRRSKTTSARLDALERAFAVVNDDESQLPVEDLAQAAQLVHEIGKTLNQQMMRKLARR
ncbi:hypothetical protein HGRIS_006337 [Hohenbuehelia grisea]|uniref:Telomere-associated protein Rif1 N-terminal domain-containing protein n=1 Tax=Hohenbuehelia grisea TaxID=104357 RepID=A0ABR3JZM1_9AGAR